VDDRVVLLPDHQPAKLVDRVQVGRHVEIHRDHRTLGRTYGGEEIVGRERLPHLRGAEAVGGEPVGLEPDAHGKDPAADDLGALHA